MSEECVVQPKRMQRVRESVVPSEEEIRETGSPAPETDGGMRKRSGMEPADFQMDPENLKNTIHMVVQSKGGTGKTFVAATLASFFQRHAKSLDLHCFDLDSNTGSFCRFGAFGVKQFSDVRVDGGEIVINSEAFNGAFNPMLESIDTDSVVVIDTGAGTSFWNLVQYIVDLDYPTLAKTCGRDWRFIFHVVISGAALAESLETVRSLRSLIDNPYIEFVVWGNEFFGDLKDAYAELEADYGPMMSRRVTLPPVPRTDLKKALERMREENLSASELFALDGYSAIERSRIHQYYYGNMARKPGVFTALQKLDWRPLSEEDI